MSFIAPLLSILLATTGGRPSADVLKSDLDPKVNPGVDFFAYANGGWLKRHPIPSSESGWGIGNEVNDEINANLRKIAEGAAKKHAKMGSDEQKVGDFWAVAMDERKADKLGMTPLKPELDRIEAIDSVAGAISEAFRLQRWGVGAFFSFSVSQDEKNSDAMAVHMYQGGLGLPERDFYFNKEAGVAKIRDEYLLHLGRVFEYSGISADDAKTAATSVMEFETTLAEKSRKLEDLRDPLRNYNKMSVDDLQQKYTPGIAWHTGLAGWNLKPSFVIVGQPEFFGSLQTILKDTPITTLRNYLRFHLVASALPFLDHKAQDLDFKFNHEVLSGQKKPRPRWKRVLDAENGAIGFVLGRIFVKEYFPPSAKKRYADLVEAFRRSYSHRIARLDWMSPATKKMAQKKLASLRKKVGYPDKWKNYSAMQIDRSSFYSNMVHASEWQFDDQVKKFGKPVDRTEWGMTPQTYNAYYDPSNNEIVLPAATFAVPGKRDADLDDALVYGYAGASTIGHEMTHGFDDEGRQFDAKGNLKEWWTKGDAAKFMKRADVMVKQFSDYEPLPGLHVNGKASLGENIADYGGLLIGVDAFKQTSTYKQGRVINGLTPMQRFFLGYALSWLSQEREQRLRRQLLSDVHAPAKWRVLGPLSNIPDFFAAFDVKPGQPMRRPADKIVRIW